MLAALALAPVPFVVLIGDALQPALRPAVQEIQQRLAELTAEVEESISGIRIVKAFAREEHMLERFRRSVARVFDQNIFSTRLQAFYSPLLGFLPSLGLGGRAPGRRPPGDPRHACRSATSPPSTPT